MKLISCELKINHLPQAFNFFQKVGLPFIAHKEYEEKEKYSKTKFGFDQEKFYIILRDNYKSRTDYQFPMEHCIHITSPSFDNKLIKKGFTCQIQTENGDSEIKQMDVQVKNLQESKKFFQEKLQMKVIKELDNTVLLEYEGKNPKILLKENKKLKNSNLIFRIQGLQENFQDQDGNKYLIEVEEDGYYDYILWASRDSKMPLWVIAVLGLLSIYMIFGKNLTFVKILWRRIRLNNELN